MPLMLTRMLVAVFVASCLTMIIHPPNASAASRADVVFLFDTTGSMGGALDAAKAQITDVQDRIIAEGGDVQFGVAELKDYPELYGDSTDLPWRLLQEITADQIAVEDAVETLQANGGGDSPESYGRALYEADLDAAVGWRPGARRLVVLVADEMPHDEDLNEGIPEELRSASVQADTGIDPGRDGVVGTADDLDWQPLLQQLRADGIPLLYVLFNGDPAYLPYWKVWTQITGGSAQDSNEEGLADTIVQLVDEGISSELPPCPVGQERDAQGECTQIRPAPDPSEASGAPSGNAQEASASEAELRGVEDTFARASEDDGVPCPIYGFAGRPQGVDEVAADFRSRNRRPALGVQFGRVLQGVPSCGPAAPISTLTGSVSLKLAGASGARTVPSTRLAYLQVAPNRPPGRYDLRFTCGPRTDGVEAYAAQTDGFTGTVLTAEGYRPISPRSVPRRILLDLACPTRDQRQDAEYDAWRTLMRFNPRTRRYTSSSDPEAFARRVLARGLTRPDGPAGAYDAHHVVPLKDFPEAPTSLAERRRRAVAAGAFRCHLYPNEAANGIYLRAPEFVSGSAAYERLPEGGTGRRRQWHRLAHGRYSDRYQDRLRQALVFGAAIDGRTGACRGGEQRFKRILTHIRSDLAFGRFMPSSLERGG